jgi:hypothetical protein
LRSPYAYYCTPIIIACQEVFLWYSIAIMDGRPTPVFRLILKIKKTFDELVKTVIKYQEANTTQRKIEIEAESKSVVRLPPEMTKYYQTENTERPRKDHREVIRMWLEGAAVAVASVLALLTLKTLLEVRRTTTATEQMAYDACVSAQILQRQLLEAQETNVLSQTMAIASTMQTAAQIETEKSYITMDFIPPRPEVLLPSDPNYEVLYSFKNDGKSAANNVHIRFNAVLVRNDEVLKINDRKLPGGLQIPYFAAGASYPVIPAIGRPVIPYVGVVDSNGNSVPKTSDGVQKVFTDSAIIAVIGNVTYDDFSGTHEDRFCISLSQMQAGTMRKAGDARPNEKTCFDYNHRKDSYTFTTKPPSVSPTTPLPEIICRPPK